MRQMDMKIDTVRAGRANMFLSPIFANAFATVTQANVELYNTDGSQGAARAAGFGAGLYQSMQQAFTGLKSAATIEPDRKNTNAYQEAYQNWLKVLEAHI